jgi:hypothetical protein
MVSLALTVIAAAHHFVQKSRFERASKRSGSGTVSEVSRHLPARPVHDLRSIRTTQTWSAELASSYTRSAMLVPAR